MRNILLRLITLAIFMAITLAAPSIWDPFDDDPCPSPELGCAPSHPTPPDPCPVPELGCAPDH
ncbi:hypothetical protein BDA99DRAFT_506999 [Phascolomyces articulosus]|uniref:Uncharacterized protein n=1 Tax=Phascolomyces articulosus TaxID=60185 RepID=A0AAD5K388_9FUNG|nr:hypothetical protein BDA99DRAFT_506999 [Phascolomyces articulosus]